MLDLQVLTGKFSEVLVYPKNSEKTGALVDSPTKSVESQMVSDLSLIISQSDLNCFCCNYCEQFIVIKNYLSQSSQFSVVT